MQPALLSPAQAAPSLELLRSLVREDLQRVNQTILDRINSDVSLIGQMAAHIIGSGGKRLRPSLTLACAKLLGYEGERHIRLAACVECIHTATLLHDDVVDESKLRRGSATANEVWGNASSVLVGDFLFSRAFQLMVDDGSLQVLRLLADTSATIAEGEVRQLMTTNEPETSRETYIQVITAKTAALFAAAGELGAVVAEQPQHEAALRSFGMNLGIAFQLVDDALDYTANEDDLGKTVGDDFAEGKITLPVILAFERGDDAQRAFLQRTLADLNQTQDDLAQALAILKHTQAIESTFELAAHYANTAREQIAHFAAGTAKSALMETVDFCVRRAY